MDKKITISVILIIIIVIILTVIFFQQQANQSVKAISAQDFSEQIETEINDATKNILLNFEDFNEGDEIRIKNKIDSIKYLVEQEYTAIEFNVNTTLYSGEKVSSIEFDFRGNITDVYQKKDQVEITFTIKHVQFDYDNWSYDIEVYEEAWDQDYYLENFYTQLLPQSSVKKII